MRAFISIELPEEVKKEILKVQKEIMNLKLIKGKTVEKENLHLTLKFLGEIDEKTLEKIKVRLKEINFESFDVSLDKLGAFSENFIRIIWISLKGNFLIELQKDIDEILKDIFPREDRFMAHITIIRPKSVESNRLFLEKLEKIELDKINFSVDNFHLKKSRLSKLGAKYLDIEIFNSS